MGQSYSKTVGAAEYDIILIGKTGHGKSATANTLVDSKDYFDESLNTTSSTKMIRYKYHTHGGIRIKVVDTPGVADTQLTKEEDLEQLEERFAEAMLVTPNGYHAFLLVFSYGGRFTDEEVQTVKCLKDIFAPDFVKKHCIMIITKGDLCEKDVKEGRVKSFSQWCMEQEGNFKDIFTECSGRAVLFNNRVKDKRQKKEQLYTLFEMIKTIGGARYKDSNFSKAKETRGFMMVREEIERAQEFISQELAELRNANLPARLEKTKELLILAEKNRDEAKKDDKGTDIFKVSLQAAEALVREIESKIEYCELLLQNEKEAKEREAHYKAIEEKEQTVTQKGASTIKDNVIDAAFALGNEVRKQHQNKDKEKEDPPKSYMSSAMDLLLTVAPVTSLAKAGISFVWDRASSWYYGDSKK